MACKLENRLCSVKLCQGVCEKKNFVKSVHVDDWTAELVIIASNGCAALCLLFKTKYIIFPIYNKIMKIISNVFRERIL